MPVARIIVTAGVLSGLVFLVSGGSYYQPAIAQQNMTGGNTTTIGGGDGAQSSSACAPTQTGGGGGTTPGTNITSITAGEIAGGNQSTTSQVRMHIEQACMAAQNNDTESVLMQLKLALNELGSEGTEGNMTTSTAASVNSTTSGEDGISVAGTSAADDYDDTADDDA